MFGLYLLQQYFIIHYIQKYNECNNHEKKDIDITPENIESIDINYLGIYNDWEEIYGGIEKLYRIITPNGGRHKGPHGIWSSIYQNLYESWQKKVEECLEKKEESPEEQYESTYLRWLKNAAECVQKGDVLPIKADLL